jgi:hypothetical protein
MSKGTKERWNMAGSQGFIALWLMAIAVTRSPTRDPSGAFIAVLSVLAALIGYGLFLRRRWAFILVMLQYGVGVGLIVLQVLRGSGGGEMFISIALGCAVIVGYWRELRRLQ